MFENKDKIVIVMEYASRGDLYDYICEKQRITEYEARHFFRQIVSAVQYCHQVNRLLDCCSHSRKSPSPFRVKNTNVSTCSGVHKGCLVKMPLCLFVTKNHTPVIVVETHGQ